MRALLVILTIASLLGCAPDPAPRCHEAYDHLIGLAKAQPDPEQRRRFVRRCQAAFEEARHRCLLESSTPEEALACRPKKIRPG